MRASTILLALLGVVAAISAALLVTALTRKPTTTTASPGASTQPSSVKVVVASRPLEALTTILPEDVTVKVVMDRESPAESLSGLEQVVGKMLRTKVVPGQALTADLFLSSGSGAVLASGLPNGMRAAMLLLPGADALEGCIYPGAMVDILASFRPTGRMQDPVSTTLAQNVLVLAVDSKTSLADESVKADKKPDNAGTSSAKWQVRRITLMVTPAVAQKVQLAEANGTLSLLMRNPGDPAVLPVRPQGLDALAMTALPPPERAVATDPSPETKPATTAKAADPIQPEAVRSALWGTEIIRGDVRSAQTFELPENQRR